MMDMLIATVIAAMALLLLLTIALIKNAGIESKHEEQAEMERWEKMKAAIEAERAKTGDSK